MDSRAALRSYAADFIRALENQDGNTLAQLLSLEPYYTKQPGSVSVSIPSPRNIAAVFRQNNIVEETFAPFKEERYLNMIINHLWAAAVFGREGASYMDAFNHQDSVCLNFKDLYSNENFWILPVFYQVVLRDATFLAQRADNELKAQGKKPTKLEHLASTHLRNFFGQTYNDRNEASNSKRWGILRLVNTLFRISFKINTLSLCEKLPTNCQQVFAIIPLSQFPKDQTATFKFYAGRLQVLSGDFEKARENLSEAFLCCPSSKISHLKPSSSSSSVIRAQRKNKQLILLYLIPINMMFGRFPKPSLLAKYSFPQFDKLSRAVKLGDLRSFNEAYSEYEMFFIRRGLFLIVEQLKILTYRNLFKRVVLVLGSSKILLSAFSIACKWLGVDIDSEEIECIVSNLIFGGFIKGYISHSAKAIVLKKDLPFPPLSETRKEKIGIQSE